MSPVEALLEVPWGRLHFEMASHEWGGRGPWTTVNVDHLYGLDDQPISLRVGGVEAHITEWHGTWLVKADWGERVYHEWMYACTMTIALSWMASRALATVPA